MTALGLSRIGHAFFGRIVLSGVSLAVRPGEVMALVGPSGCGKSTLVHIAAGLIEPREGRVTRDYRRHAMVFQEPRLLPWLTAEGNIAFALRLARWPRAGRDPRVAEAARLAELGPEDLAKFPVELSGGMRQRVAICRGLINDPALLLMDEPFSALDAISRDDMNVALADIWDRFHKTAIFITHSIREAVFLSDRILVMSRRPSTVCYDVRVDFPRPRNMKIQETVEFNELCGVLRKKIEEGYKNS